MFSGKNILIAGGNGFIGRHLHSRLEETNNNIYVVDNFSTSKNDGFSKVHELDITNSEELLKEFSDYSLDVIINAASPASPKYYSKMPIETLRAGSYGTENLLCLAAKAKAHFIQFSTSEVYGDPITSPQNESMNGNVNCYGPRSMYDEAKRYAEALVYSYRMIHGIKTTIVRIFNTYGSGMDLEDGRVIPAFLNAIKHEVPLTINGSGSQTRSFCFIDDLISGIIMLIDNPIEGPVNLGNDEEFTINELAQILIKKVGFLRINYTDTVVDDPMQRRPDLTLAKSLGYTPTISLSDGLDRMLYFYGIKRI